MFIYADAHYFEIISDDIIFNDAEVKNYFNEKYILVGPEVNSKGEYIKFSGDESLRLDIDGKVVSEVNFRFFNGNAEYLESSDIKVYCRVIILGSDDCVETLLFYRRKDRYLLLDEDSNEDSARSQKFTDESGEFLPEIIFTKDLDDNNAIAQAAINYINEYMQDCPGKFTIEDAVAHYSDIKIYNGIKISYTLTE
jgi:hypothetical protein